MAVETRRAGWPVLAMVLLATAGVDGCGAPRTPADGSALALLGKRAESDLGMVAAAHPLAVEAAVGALREGGTAVDAAVAGAFVLGVVEPMMAGIGGGGSLTVWDAGASEAHHLEFYASSGADPDLALDTLPDSLVSRERQVAVPGTVAGLLAAHRRWGRLDRRTILAPAVRVASEGFPVHSMLARVVAEEEDKLTYDSAAAALFYPGGEPLRAGERLVQPELASTLARIEEEGEAGFYRGPVADDLVRKLESGGNPITRADLAAFRPRWRRPVCSVFRGYVVVSAPPPLAGVEVLETLELLEAVGRAADGSYTTRDASVSDLADGAGMSRRLPVRSAASLGLLVDAVRAARADRRAYVGAPEVAPVPAVRLSSAAYVSQRRSVLGTTVPDRMDQGDPWESPASAPEPDCAELDPMVADDREPLPAPDPDSASSRRAYPEDEEDHTTHLSVVDADGNAVSLTYTMGQYFGSGVVSGGAFLNTAARNFEGPAANQRGPGRTPRSSTSPTLVLADGEVRLVVGSPGSGRIPPAIVQMILYTLVHGLDPAEAVRMPRVYPHVSSPTVAVEAGFPPKSLEALARRGYRLEVHGPLDPYFGGVHMVAVTPDGRRIGVADPRRDGVASGTR